MEGIDSLRLIFVVISTGGSFLLALLVFKAQPQRAINRIFSILGLLSTAWLLTNFISVHPAFLSSSLWWIRLSIFFATPVNAVFFLLAHTLPEEKFTLQKKYLFAIVLITVVVMIAALSPLVFSGVEIVDNSPQPIVGPGLILFGITAIYFNFAAILTLSKKYKRTSGVTRQQIGLVLTGVLILFGLVITTIFIPAIFLKVNTFVSFLPLYVLIFLGITAYATVRHHLFNLKVIATEALIVIIWTILLSKVFVGVSTSEKLIDSLIFLTIVLFGIRLRKSVIQEVLQREKLEQLSKELAGANEELKKLDRAKSEFISLASHQLRAPLTIIKGYISLLLEGTLGVIADQSKNAINIISASAEQLIKLVNDLLDLSRIEAGKIKYEFRRGDLIALVKSVINEFTPRASAKGVAINFDNPYILQEFSFDPDKMREAVINLVDNALKYTPGGKKITISTGPAGQMLRLSVRDEGMGIKKEDIGKLFTKFARTEEAQRMDPNGMGIGLYFVKRVIDDHGGKVWVESEGSGKGSTFFVELPLNR